MSKEEKLVDLLNKSKEYLILAKKNEAILDASTLKNITAIKKIAATAQKALIAQKSNPVREQGAMDFNPGLFGIYGLEAVEAASLGLAAIPLVEQSFTGGNINVEHFIITRSMKSEPSAKFNQSYTYRLFNIEWWSLGTTKVYVDLNITSNDLGEFSAKTEFNVKESAEGASATTINFSNRGVFAVEGTSVNDPRAYPFRVSYSGSFDPRGNGFYYFEGEFEFNAFGLLRFIKHDTKNKSTIPIQGSDSVVATGEEHNFSIPALPEKQRKILLKNIVDKDSGISISKAGYEAALREYNSFND